MKNKGLMAVVFVFAILIGGAFLVGNASTAQAQYYGDYGYDDCDYYYCGDDYDYGGYDDYCDYGCYDDYGGYDDYGYDDCDYYYCGDDYGYDDYGYDDCDYYDCDDSYDECGYGCGYDECDYGYCDDYDYDDCYSCDEPEPAPAQPINIQNNNSNTNYSNNENYNTNNVNIKISNSGFIDEPVRREREVVRERENDNLVCTPSTQSAGVNQTVNLSVSGGDGEYRWNAPGSINLNRRGSGGISLAYGTSGFKTITVESDGDVATCSVQVTGGQVLAEFIELPDTGAGGLNNQMGNMITFIVSLILGAVSLAYFKFRNRVNA